MKYLVILFLILSITGCITSDCNIAIYNKQGMALFKKGEYDQAIANYDKVIEINPKCARAYDNRGTAFLRKGQYNRAIADYNKAIEFNTKKCSGTYNNRGLAFYNKDQYKQAISDYNKAIEIDPKSVIAFGVVA